MQAFQIGPHKTPRSVKFLIWITAILSILAPITTYILQHYFQLSGPGNWFSLSLPGIKQGWIWQPLTYFFFHTTGVGISLSFLFALFFHLLLLWFAGSEIAFRFGTKAFLLFYFGAGLFSGLISLILLFLFSSSAVIVGSGPPVYALLMLWAMLYPDLELFFLFLIRIKAKWLVALFLGLALVINLSYGQFIPFVADFCGILFGFVVGRFVWKLPNPFPLNLEFPKRGVKKGGKIIDISVFQESDEAFMDRMLDKIAKLGEESLTKREKERMKKISEKKNSSKDL